MKEENKNQILGMYLSDWPKDWSYDDVITKLNSTEFLYASSALVPTDVYSDWHTPFLATEINDMVELVSKMVDPLEDLVNDLFHDAHGLTIPTDLVIRMSQLLGSRGER